MIEKTGIEKTRRSPSNSPRNIRGKDGITAALNVQRKGAVAGTKNVTQPEGTPPLEMPLNVKNLLAIATEENAWDLGLAITKEPLDGADLAVLQQALEAISKSGDVLDFLSLEGQKLGWERMAPLANHFSHVTWLSTLDLSDNALTMEAVKPLLSSCVRNPTVRRVLLEKNWIGLDLGGIQTCKGINSVIRFVRKYKAESNGKRFDISIRKNNLGPSQRALVRERIQKYQLGDHVITDHRPDEDIGDQQLRDQLDKRWRAGDLLDLNETKVGCVTQDAINALIDFIGSAPPLCTVLLPSKPSNKNLKLLTGAMQERVNRDGKAPTLHFGHVKLSPYTCEDLGLQLLGVMNQ